MEGPPKAARVNVGQIAGSAVDEGSRSAYRDGEVPPAGELDAEQVVRFPLAWFNSTLGDVAKETEDFLRSLDPGSNSDMITIQVSYPRDELLANPVRSVDLSQREGEPPWLGTDEIGF